MLFEWGTLSAAGARKPVRQRDFAVYLLTPGFSNAYYVQALGLSDVTLAKYVAWARDLADADPSFEREVVANAASITMEDGVLMAQRRGPTQLVYWSRLALGELLRLTGNTAQVASILRCSQRTVQYAGTTRSGAYDPLSGRRRITASQAAPPGRWGKRHPDM
jgi:hypothetical protein